MTVVAEDGEDLTALCSLRSLRSLRCTNRRWNIMFNLVCACQLTVSFFSAASLACCSMVFFGGVWQQHWR